jgi:hypothetical protein
MTGVSTFGKGAIGFALTGKQKEKECLGKIQQGLVVRNYKI